MSLAFTLRQLEYFEAVASEGSLTRASARCHVSASALALALDDLERHLGLQLLIRRKGKGVTLTPAGSRVLSLARQLLAGAETLAQDAALASSQVAGRLSVGCFSTLAPFYLPELLDGFQGRHRGLVLDCTEASAPELHEQLLQGRIDTALMYYVDVSDELSFEPVHEIRPHVIVAADHPLAQRGSIQLGELAAEPMVALDIEPTGRNTEHLFESLDLRLNIAYRTTSLEVARCLVGRGMGYAVMFQQPSSPWTYGGHAVVRLDLDDRVPTTVVGLARPAGAPNTARHQALSGYIRQLVPEWEVIAAAVP